MFTLETCCGYGYGPARDLHLLPRIFKGRRELTGRRRNRGAFQGVGPYLGTNPFQGARPFTKKRELFPGPPPASPGSFAFLRGPRAPVVRGPDPRPGGAARPRRTEDSPPRRAPAPGARGPVPPRGERGREDTARGPGVLFNFPSRYLSTFGLVPVFSLRWSLPPALGCIPKQPDSEKNRTPAGRGPLPASHRPRAKPPSEGLGPPARAERSGLPDATFPSPRARSGDSALGSSLFARRY
ncbi:basic proline-rich [Labeo rohita]|uniref:Basic proline-rich n=1 Tax=Labeo rohita TaxID=84645 RepID=A0A498NLZ3_LABRO|nr:basic proline-rich [Labeo rohita]